MRGLVFAVIAVGISSILSLYLPVPPGLFINLQLLAIIAAIAGTGLYYILEKVGTAVRLLAWGGALAIFTVSIISFFMVARGEPGEGPEIAIYALTVTIFAPIGFLCEIAGVKFF